MPASHTPFILHPSYLILIFPALKVQSFFDWCNSGVEFFLLIIVGVGDWGA